MLLLLLNRRRLRSMRRPLVEVLEGSRSTEVLLLTREGRFVSMRRSVVEVSVEGSRSTSSSVVPLLLLRVERFRLTRRRLRLRLRSVVIGGVVGSRLDGYGVGGGTDGRRRWIRASRENGVGHGSRRGRMVGWRRRDGRFLRSSLRLNPVVVGEFERLGIVFDEAAWFEGREGRGQRRRVELEGFIPTHLASPALQLWMI